MDISSLLSQLEEVQQQKSTSRLSERNIIELITKLKELGFLGDELLYTVNGKEYITTERLKAEILSHLNIAGGRVLLADLPAKIGVDLSHIERQGEAIVAESDSKIIGFGNELIAIKFFDSMASEIDEMLREEGVLELGELARRFSLSREMIVAQLSERIGSVIQARMEGAVLYTSQYIERLKSLLRGALRATSIPTNVTNLAKDLQLSVGAGGGSIISHLIEELIQSNSVKGILKGGGSTWIPDVYANNQKEAIKNFYQQNQFIEYDIVSKYGIQNPQKFLQDEFSGHGIPLETTFVSNGLLEQIDGGIEEALGSGKWIDVMSLLPTVLSENDASKLLSLSNAATAGTILSGTCTVSNQFIDELKQRSKQFGLQQGQQALKAGIKNLKVVSNNSKQKSSRQDDDDDDDTDTKKGKGKKKGGKGKGGGKNKGGDKGGLQQQQSSSVATHPWDPYLQSQFVPSVENLSENICEWFPDTEGIGKDAEFPSALASLIKQDAMEEFEKTVKSAFVADAEKLKQQREQLVKQIEDNGFKFGLYMRGLELFAEKQDVFQVLGRHLVRQIGCELLDCVLLCMEIDGGQNQSQQKNQRATPLKDQERNQIVKSLSEEFSGNAKSVLDIWTKTSDPEEFYEQVSQSAELLGLRFKKIDKKVEKEQSNQFKDDLLVKLKGAQDPVESLATVIPFLVTKFSGKMVSIPGRSIGDVLDIILKDKLEEEQYQILKDFHSLIFESLKVKGVQDERWEELNNQLLEKMNQLITIAESQ